MRLGEHLNAKVRAGAIPAPTHPVIFRALARDAHGEQYVVDANAVLAFVDEDQRDRAIDAAEAEIRLKYPDASAPAEKRRNAVAYQILLYALRDAEDPRVQLAATVEELRKALVQPVATRLYSEYIAFVDEEFPATPAEGDFAGMVDDAEKNS